ncbi:aminoglycoside N3-acetyltransferase [Paenibacillus alvei TS-15]|jgi:aminoglycoside 3-N-acetyltransferase|uniref:Aminoglycoside N(3)-acetyltransferase n=1 Tax=Paenibacillus alvei TS-15 TaxID=1117108 RepID=S9SU88_PAEAL|nr:AAC(3) family N-acetyltransferase [Paenibacillus alvei]EPY09347.1 aminoglycoside N3-acetyltransferase [Paenibacillus alvei TS-15]
METSIALQTRKTIIDDLRRIGVREGMTLIVHSSLKSLGKVVGGPVTVILALEEAVGMNGNIVMPTQTEHLCEPTEFNDSLTLEEITIIKENMPIYYPDITPTSYMGIIPETFRKQNGVLRSSHPHVSFAAWGKDAERITENHKLDYGLSETSPLGRIYELEGYILLLGVPTNTNTSLHLAEYRQKNTFIKPKVWGVKMPVDGNEQWITYDDINNESDDFNKIFDDFKSNTNVVKEGLVGEAVSYLIPQREMVDYALGWMNRNRR